jgi:segregation and condensation protein A
MIRLKLPNFEGPLDLLLYLIRKNELDIKKISLAQITREYLEYITMLKDLDLNVAGEYIVMATTLIKIKVRSILPHHTVTEIEEPEDEAEILIKKLKEYEKFKNLAQFLREKENKAIRCFPRGITCERRINITGLNTLTVIEISRILLEIVKRTAFKPIYSIRSTKFDIKNRMEYILKIISKKRILFFSDLILKKEVEEIIVTFMAVLELVKIRRIRLIQTKRFGRIKLYDTSTEMEYY